MNTLQLKINNIKESVLDTFRRYPKTVILMTILSAFCVYFIYTEDFDENIVESLTLGAALSFLLETSFDYNIIKNKYTSLLAPLSIVVSILVLTRFDNEYTKMAVGGLIFAVCVLALFVLYYQRENRLVFSHLVKTSFLCSVFTGLISSGLMTCLAAFNFLIYQFEDIWKPLGAISVLTNLLCFSVLFISFIPKKDEEISVPKPYRVMIHKALFYIYLLLIGILYLYILKVCIIHKMPVGKFNWFGCFSLLFFIFFHLSVDEDDGAVQVLFKKYGAYLMIPIVIMQAIGLYIRISHYGLTMARYTSIVMVLAAIAYGILALLNVPVRYSFVIIAAISLIVTCTPLNIIDVPNRNQEKILRTALTDAGFVNVSPSESGSILDKSRLTKNANIDKDNLREIRSSYEYLNDSPGKKSQVFKEFSKTDLAGSFGYGAYEDGLDEKDTYTYYTDLENKEIDISGYKTITRAYGYSAVYGKIDMTDFFMGLSHTDKEIRFIEGNTCIIFESIDFERDEEGLSDVTWSGFVLKK